jgi:aquaporin Z
MRVEGAATSAHAFNRLWDIARWLGLTVSGPDLGRINIPVTNTSVNPARSTGVAVYVGGWAVKQLWLFWLAPIAGTLIGALTYHFIGSAR